MKPLVYMEYLLYIQHHIRHFKESYRIMVCSLLSGTLYNLVEDKNKLINNQRICSFRIGFI